MEICGVVSEAVLLEPGMKIIKIRNWLSCGTSKENNRVTELGTERTLVPKKRLEKHSVRLQQTEQAGRWWFLPYSRCGILHLAFMSEFTSLGLLFCLVANVSRVQHLLTEVFFFFFRHQGKVRPLQTAERARGVPVHALHWVPGAKIRTSRPEEDLHRGHAVIPSGRRWRLWHD